VDVEKRILLNRSSYVIFGEGIAFRNPVFDYSVSFSFFMRKSRVSYA